MTPDKIKKYNREYYLRNREKIKKKSKEYRILNKDEIKEKKKEYYQKNKERINKKKKEYKKNRIHIDPLFKLKHNLRNRTSRAFKAKFWRKNGGTENILGASYEEVRTYIENKFTDGMSWDNYGKWHIDHIIPLSSAKTEKELKGLCHYTNLQPLWAEDNIIKGSKILYYK